jgi:hypothetical protein
MADMPPSDTLVREVADWLAIKVANGGYAWLAVRAVGAKSAATGIKYNIPYLQCIANI